MKEKNMKLLWIWMDALLMLMTTYSQDKPNIVHYHKHIVHPTATLYQGKLNMPTSNFFQVKYHITFRNDKCCPTIELFTCSETCLDDWPRIRTDVYYNDCRVTTGVSKYVPFDSQYILVTNVEYSISGCHMENGYHVCDIARTMAPIMPSRAILVVRYGCKDEVKTLNLTIDAEIQHENNHAFLCEPIQIDYCKKQFGFNHTAFPNALGHLSQLKTNFFLNLVLNTDRQSGILKCYQHSRLFMCLALFPACQSGNKRLFPCKKMCHETISSCARELKIMQLKFYCNGHFPDSLDPDLCFYKPVMCPQPQQPESGYITTDGNLLGNTTVCICNEGYEIQGDTVRHCTVKGLWNSTDPICIPIDGLYPNLLLEVLLPIAVLFVVVLSIIILCAYHRHNIYLLIFHNKWRMREVDELEEVHPKKTLFVTYSSEDKEEVSENFIPNARRELPGWDLITYQEDFLPGRPILDCIHEGVWNSQAVLILLTANFISSSFCIHEFLEAQTRQVMDSNFRLIVVLFTKDNHKTPSDLSIDFPEELREYVKTRIYLPLGAPLFWSKLRCSLLKQQK